MMAKIGWEPAPGETDDVHNLRSNLIAILGSLGEDPETTQKATAMAKKYLEQPDSVDPSIARNVLKVAARFGDTALFQQYVAAMRRRTAPEQFYSVAGALASFRDPQLVQQWLEIIVSPEIRNQDAAGFIADLIHDPETNRVAWEWVKAHWPQVEAQLTLSSGGTIVGATRSFCDAGSRDDVQKFFTEHKVASSERTLKQTLERIDSCISYRSQQQSSVSAWLQQHAGGAVSGGAR
jgi:aminopeptidase N